MSAGSEAALSLYHSTLNFLVSHGHGFGARYRAWSPIALHDAVCLRFRDIFRIVDRTGSAGTCFGCFLCHRIRLTLRVKLLLANGYFAFTDHATSWLLSNAIGSTQEAAIIALRRVDSHRLTHDRLGHALIRQHIASLILLAFHLTRFRVRWMHQVIRIVVELEVCQRHRLLGWWCHNTGQVLLGLGSVHHGSSWTSGWLRDSQLLMLLIWAVVQLVQATPQVFRILIQLLRDGFQSL